MMSNWELKIVQIQMCVILSPFKSLLLINMLTLLPQCTTASLPLTEELLFARKAQAIVDFCLECRNLLKAFKLDISPLTKVRFVSSSSAVVVLLSVSW